jgi:hypothetical protein
LGASITQLSDMVVVCVGSGVVDGGRLTQPLLAWLEYRGRIGGWAAKTNLNSEFIPPVRSTYRYLNLKNISIFGWKNLCPSELSNDVLLSDMIANRYFHLPRDILRLRRIQFLCT